MIDILNPEIIILGSIFGRARNFLEPHMQQVIAEEAIVESRRVCRIVPAMLSENIGDMAALTLASTVASDTRNAIKVK